MGVDAGSGMQFDKVDMPGPVAAPACARCKRALDEYFERGGQIFCGACAEGLRGGAGSFWRAVLYGAGAAVMGTIVWFAILNIFNYELGLIGIAVGLLVGIAVRNGSRGAGGWKYQALAMALTYASITASYMPLVLKGMVEAENKKTADSDGAKTEAEGSATEDGQQAASGQPAQAKKTPAPPPSLAWIVIGFVFVFAIALATPFLAGADNFMGWIIIGIALYEAWKINRPVPLQGPFRLAGGLSVPAPAPITPATPPPAVGT